MFFMTNTEGKKSPGLSEVYESGYAFSRKLINYSNGVLKPQLYVQYLNHVKSNKDRQAYKVGFDSWEQVFNGGLQAGLYVMGAVPGLGKTTLALQIATTVAKSNKHAVFVSLEMSETELYAKCLSNLSYTLSKDNDEIRAKKLQDILCDQELKKIEDSIFSLMKTYNEQINPYLNIIGCNDEKDTFTTENIENICKNYKEVHNCSPVIIIDYLQLLEAYSIDEEFASKRLEMNYVVKALKSMSRKYDVPILVISAITRSSYTKDGETYDSGIDMSCFKETGNIEYTADALIVLTRGEKVKSLVKSEKTKINVNVLKNRFGPCGKNLKLDFIPEYSYFEEPNSDK